ALSGGLIGLGVNQRDYTGSLQDTPIFIGCSDIDPHIPLERVKESTQTLSALGGNVTEKIYPGFGHTVNQDELDGIKTMMKSSTSQRGIRPS
ncbi:MAG: phospholipase, partial [Okeania sp. SIO3H1]|nr:phospholipase [Okeania sp. SIO3H1]